ncbi:MAG: hypothetical protein CVV23_08585 [Ignavibacteriae bacterium HGW-Ignavibacteriae-2]|jgi:hypothetical protein|nr:MAG: hypothetical protein CVV23_08585 [Ignavibacteriae bacterium HGW-Ignavibacteriae-2]
MQMKTFIKKISTLSFLRLLPLILLVNSQLSIIISQVIYEPVRSDIYEFLDRQAIKGNIQLDWEARPFSRQYIADKVKIIREKINVQFKSGIERFTKVEEDELKFWEKEFGTELNKFTPEDIIKELEVSESKISTVDLRGLEKGNYSWFGKDKYGRMRLFSYEDSLFSLKISPIAGYGISSYGDQKGYNRSVGAHIFIAYGNNFGAGLQMSDNGEFGDDVDYKKNFSKETGHDFYLTENGHEFSDVRAQINYNWDWGSISLKKDYLLWGNAYFGNLILSDKAPSFPHFYFEMKPVSWLRFNYVHGWIHSGVIDSSRSQIFKSSLGNTRTYNSFIKKYFVSNMLSFSPYSWMDFSLGNSIIYAGDVRPEMFIPFNFFKYMDRDTGKGAQEDGNGTLHFDIAIWYPQNFKFYSTLFVDVTSIKTIIGKEWNDTWAGYTFGFKRVDLLIPDLDLTLEYTRINPWVYEHKLLITNYKHIDYPLGHWLGQNADQIRVQFDYQLFRGLKFNAYFERLRKGGLGDISLAYNANRVSETFLYGANRQDNVFGFECKYQPIHELNIQLNYTYSEITDEENDRTPEFMLSKKNKVQFGVYYGLP